MSKGVNKAIIVGNLGKDPEVRYAPNGSAVANISVATSEQWKDKTTGEKQERVEWHRVVFFGKIAEVVGQCLKKGAQVYIEGKIQTRKWQDKEGKDRYTTEIVAHEMQMLGNKGGGDTAQARADGQANAYAQAKGRASAPGDKPAQPASADFDDDIPF